MPAPARALGRSAVAPGLLPKLLAERSPEAALADSERAFLELYDLSSDTSTAAPDSADALASRLEERGLMATAFDGGSLDLLRRLDHPVLIPIAVDSPPAGPGTDAASATNAARPHAAVAEADRRWLALTGFDGDRVWLAGLVPGRVVSVAQNEIAPRWLEAGIIVWRNHESLAARVERGGAAASVRWLQTSLAELRYFEGAANGVFDARTADALRDFQSANDLVEDGVVGPLTQIALYAQLDRYPVPRLSASSVRPPPDPLSFMPSAPSSIGSSAGPSAGASLSTPNAVGHDTSPEARHGDRG